MKVLLVGGGAREHAIAEALCREGRAELHVVAESDNPGLKRLARGYTRHDECDARWIARWAHEQAMEFAFVGPEEPLNAGVPDALRDAGVPTVGPSAAAARLETSKRFTRELMDRHRIAGAVEHHYFTDPDALARFLHTSGREWAIKPVGLTAGKGVRVMGVQLHSVDEAAEYGRLVIAEAIGGTPGVVVEERLVGEEFTLQAFVDGDTVVPMPLVQDYKRAFEGDRGPNTGSMGSYSREEGGLPFLDEADESGALAILRSVVGALATEGVVYQGILYGQFMMTARGVRVVELNARFGDPEAANVLPLLETPFLDVCLAITERRLSQVPVRFARRATVCKYLAPPGYGTQPRSGVPLLLREDAIRALGVRVYYANVAAAPEAPDAVLTTTGRAVALVGIAQNVAAAEAAVENALEFVDGEYHIRHDIGKRHLVERSTRESLLRAAVAP